MKWTYLNIEYRIQKKIYNLLCTEGITESQGIIVLFQRNNDSYGTRIQAKIKPKERIILECVRLEFSLDFSDADGKFFPIHIGINGFQSWTHSQEFMPWEKPKDLNSLAKPWLGPYGDYLFSYKRKGVLQSYTYIYTKTQNCLSLLGSLSEGEGYTIFTYFPKQRKWIVERDCRGLELEQEYLALDIGHFSGEESHVFDAYFASMKIPKPSIKPCTGWTSWYNYYTSITEDLVLQNVKAFSDNQVPIDIIQIDDGYQESVGDWLCINSKFPHGMKYLVDQIHQHKFKAGLWLAPFVCEKRSRLFQEHPDFLLRDHKGKLVKAGYNPLWSGFFYALDFLNPNLQEYLRHVFEQVLGDWGFDMVKLDFLYAAARIPRSSKTRGQIMQEAMQFLRQATKDKIILGCGVPLGSAFGLVDYCRIGSDVALEWESNWLKRIGYKERVSTYNSLCSTIARRHLSLRAFGNDPDVFILRKENHKLTPAQQNTLFLVNLSLGDLVFTSDDIRQYDDATKKSYLSLFPFPRKKIFSAERHGNVYQIHFCANHFEYLVLANLGSQKERIFLKQGTYFVGQKKEFWEGEREIEIFPYDSVCLRIMDEKQDVVFLGGIHLFPGCELKDLQIENRNIRFELYPEVRNCQEVWFCIPCSWPDVKINAQIPSILPDKLPKTSSHILAISPPRFSS